MGRTGGRGRIGSRVSGLASPEPRAPGTLRVCYGVTITCIFANGWSLQMMVYSPGWSNVWP